MARLVFLGRLEDLAGAAAIDTSAATLAAALKELATPLRDEAESGKVRFAVNGAVLARGVDIAAVDLAEHDEVALLPPVSGG